MMGADYETLVSRLGDVFECVADLRPSVRQSNEQVREQAARVADAAALAMSGVREMQRPVNPDPHAAGVDIARALTIVKQARAANRPTTNKLAVPLGTSPA
jgi:hypothetical protein